MDDGSRSEHHIQIPSRVSHDFVCFSELLRKTDQRRRNRPYRRGCDR